MSNDLRVTLLTPGDIDAMNEKEAINHAHALLGELLFANSGDTPDTDEHIRVNLVKVLTLVGWPEEIAKKAAKLSADKLGGMRGILATVDYWGTVTGGDYLDLDIYKDEMAKVLSGGDFDSVHVPMPPPRTRT